MSIITTTKTITVPKLQIRYENDTESPRIDGGNIGHIILNKSIRNINEKIFDIDKYYKDNSQIIKVYSIDYRNYSGDSSYYLSKDITQEYLKSLDDDEEDEIIDSNLVYIITEKTLNESITTLSNNKELEESIKAELKMFQIWCNGQVLGYTLLDDDGEVKDACCGFYDIEDIREELPEEFKNQNLNDYLTFK